MSAQPVLVPTFPFCRRLFAANPAHYLDDGEVSPEQGEPSDAISG